MKYLLFWYSTDWKRWKYDRSFDSKEEADEQANMYLKRIFTQVRRVG